MKNKLLVIFMAGIFLFSGAACAAKPSGQGSAPAFTATDINGKTLDSSALKGKIIVVNFWATWCPPCRVEIPDFVDFYDKNRSKGLEIIGFSVDEMTPEQLRNFVQKNKMTYPVALAPESVIRAFDPGQYIPTTFIIDKKGIIRHKQVGAMDKATLADWFVRLSGE